MKAIKKINNNVAVFVDNNNNELIAFGKGLGFPQMPYEITDLSMIEMTFYRLSDQLYSLLNEIPEGVFEISAKVVTRARTTLNKSLNPNVVFSIADHINFAIERMQKYKTVKLVFSYDIEQLYPNETLLGRYALELIQRELYVTLPESEAFTIAMHFVNAVEETSEDIDEEKIEQIIISLTNQLEKDFNLKIDKSGFNYNRFVMHIRYLIKRIQDGKQFMDNCNDFLKSMRDSLPLVYESANRTAQIINELYGVDTTEDEILYLMIHINRMIDKGRSTYENND